jgi:HTH-type transcriptional regulator, cell division transcriptional repressor
LEIDYKVLGERVAKRRKVLNLTQDNVAEATGLSNNHISNIENNHSIPSIETLLRICEVLDVTPDYLLLGIFRQTNDSLLSKINQKIKLCDERKLELVDHFMTWVVDEKL